MQTNARVNNIKIKPNINYDIYILLRIYFSKYGYHVENLGK